MRFESLRGGAVDMLDVAKRVAGIHVCLHVFVPTDELGVLIGRKGESIQEIRSSCADVDVSVLTAEDPWSPVQLVGSIKSVLQALRLVLAKVDGASRAAARSRAPPRLTGGAQTRTSASWTSACGAAGPGRRSCLPRRLPTPYRSPALVEPMPR